MNAALSRLKQVRAPAGGCDAHAVASVGAI
jgi:hypothetical protein